jgi:hypothetical protein
LQIRKWFRYAFHMLNRDKWLGSGIFKPPKIP